MDGIDMVLAVARKVGIYSDEEAQLMARAAEARLADTKALVYGGTLADGTSVPGMKALYDATLRQLQETKLLRERVEALLGSLTPPPPGVSS